jgi:hypothetical protein
MTIRIALACLAVLAVSGREARADEAVIRFDRDIRPILSENCYACHGPGEQEAGLRLDSLEAAGRELESGSRAIVPGDASASELIARIDAEDADTVMPPPHSRKTLTAAEKAALKRWVEAGAPYEQHWSFAPIRRPPVPEVAGAGPPNPIDRFIETRLAAEGLPINGEADRPTLIRRLSFALTGLPPTPAEVDAFVAAADPEAYDRLVERLLASPRHGEEMARHWLDAARYADTHGLHLDNEREMWAYRDWVVKAFNDGMPFDRFTIEQLAGDLLPDATPGQQTATGFSRCNVTSNEAGSIDAELLFRYAVDRTTTTINAWMGLTGQCAVCHDHKFDPISMREFYSLYAFFNSAADPAMDGNARRTAPVIVLQDRDEERQLAELDAAVDAAGRLIDAVLGGIVYDDPATAVSKPDLQWSDTVWLEDGYPRGADVRSGPGPAARWIGGGEAFSGDRCLDRTATGLGQDFFLGMDDPFVVPARATLFAHIWLDPANPPTAVMLEFHTGSWNHRAVWGDWSRLQVVDVAADSAKLFRAGNLPRAGRWERLAIAASKLGIPAGSKISGISFLQSGGHVRWDGLGVAVSVDPQTDPGLSLAAWWKSLTGADDEKLAAVPEAIRRLVKQGMDTTTEPADRERVRRHWLTRVWTQGPGPLKTAVRDLDAAVKVRDAVQAARPRTLVFRDMLTMRESFVMQRGAYDKPGEKVDRGTPAFLPPLLVADGAVPSRLDLARWLVSPEHPLTARVAANRLWQQFFGTGLVKTSEDFGLQGQPPSHPELLDWLAAEYRDCGWDTRRMIRLLVGSRAFRRSGVANATLLDRDPENRLRGRGPRIRLDAEQIRDNALAVSGLLVTTMGGRGARPYQPDNIWEPVAFTDSNTRFYVRDSGDNLYRRSLYTFLKRTAPPPFLSNFDAPNREQFCSRRERSNTPLQALQLMNDTQHVEAARALAARALSEGSADDNARIVWLYRTVLARRPSSREAAILAESLAGHRARYAADPNAAGRLISHGESTPPESLPKAELAAWTLLCNTLLNLDETLTRN